MAGGHGRRATHPRDRLPPPRHLLRPDRRSRPPSLLPNPSPRLGFRARHRLHCRRGSGVPGGSSSSSTVPPRHEIDTLGGFLFEWWSIFDARTREKPREGGAGSSVDVCNFLFVHYFMYPCL